MTLIFKIVEMNRNRELILLVEDDPNDVFLMQRAFRHAEIPNQLHIVEDGDKAINYLAGTGSYSDREKYPLPSLVLLDLKLPLRSGLEVLEWIRSQPGLKRLIVIILTSSRESSDIAKAYDLGANSYMVKPASPQVLIDLAKTIKSYWMTYNEPPRLTA